MSDPRQTLTEEELQEAGNFNVLDSQGKPVQFSSIYSDQKTIVVFIRKSLRIDSEAWFSTPLYLGHFFCGVRSTYNE
jgi:hypothetical protein